jgi:hypothetical protein
MEDLAGTRPGTPTRIHHMIKSHRISDGGLLFSAKLVYLLRLPESIPSENIQAALKSLMILPNEERKIECRLEAYIGGQQARGAAFASRIIQVLDAVSRQDFEAACDDPIWNIDCLLEQGVPRD